MTDVKASMKKRGVVQTWTSGSAWSSIKNAFRSTVPFFRKAAPFALPALLASTAATPFMIKAILAAKDAKKSEQAAREAASRKPEAPEAEAEPEAPAPDEAGPSPDETLVQTAGACSMGGGFCQMGAAERASFGRFGVFVDGAVVPNDVYRASVWQRAQKLRRRGLSGAAATAIAKKTVDRALGARGASIYIPGARPGRRTR
jgi:hypothetical protein